MRTFSEEIQKDLFIQEKTREILSDAVIVVADNVAEFLVETRSDIGIGDIPNIAPPFKRVFIEFKALFGNEAVHRIGLLFNYTDLRKDKLELPEFAEIFLKSSEIRWFCKADLIVSGKYNSIYQIVKVCSWTFCVKEDGNLWFEDLGGGKMGGIDLRMQNEVKDALTESMIEEIHCNEVNLYIAWFAISLMHCKNVKKVPRDWEHQNLTGRRKRHKLKIRYYILEIEPMKTILKIEGKYETVGLKQALHICRGHFKDYRDGSGLFGKYKDIYWWEDHTAGSISKGVIGKDYRISLDDGTPGGNDEVHG